MPPMRQLRVPLLAALGIVAVIAAWHVSGSLHATTRAPSVDSSQLLELAEQVKKLQSNPSNTAEVQQLSRRVEQLETQLREARVTQHREVQPSDISLNSLDAKSPPALPSTRMQGATKDELKRHDELHAQEGKTIYGGKGDPVHLGGFTGNDKDGQSPALWTYLIKILNIRSMVDVGCGKGISTTYMLKRNVDVLCVEGSHDAVQQSLLPADRIVEHDFSRGPWWPDRTFDLLWAVEFLEHVGRQHMHNYLPIFDRAAFLAVTHSVWGGWHHVEIHGAQWWISKMQAMGFVFMPYLTKMCREVAKLSHKEAGAQHLRTGLLIFANPRVARLHKHDHLIGGAGCQSGPWTPAPCTGQDALPERYEPVWSEPTPWDDVAMATVTQTYKGNMSKLRKVPAHKGGWGDVYARWDYGEVDPQARIDAMSLPPYTKAVDLFPIEEKPNTTP